METSAKVNVLYTAHCCILGICIVYIINTIYTMGSNIISYYGGVQKALINLIDTISWAQRHKCTTDLKGAIGIIMPICI